MIKRAKLSARFHSIAVQLFLFFFAGMLIPVLIGGYLSYVKSAQTIEEQVSKVASLTITQVSDKMDLIFKKIEDTSMMFLGSEVVRKALEGTEDEFEHEQNHKRAQEYLASMMSNSAEIMDIYLFDINKQNSVFSSKITYRDLWETAWFESILAADGKPVWFGLAHKSYLKGSDIGIPVFGLGRAIKSFEGGAIIGVVFIEVRGDAITKELGKVKFGDKGYTYVVDDNNRYIYHPDADKYGVLSSFIMPQHKQIFHDKERSLLMIPETLENGWHVTGVVSVKELVAHSLDIRNLTIWIALASGLYAVIMGYYVTRKIGRPLVNLSKLMRRGEAGDLSVRCGVVGKNELGQLGRSFNKMISQIDALIVRIGEEESQKKKAEIRALRYQINPHFLYNTLNSIRWMAKLNRTEDVVNAISTLVHLLEASLERNGAFMKLGDELELLEKYMVIQQYRYDNKITLKVDCPSALREVSIPRMLLQPIVENAIFHGIAPKDEDGIIEINVFPKGEDIVIRIEDDGVGIEEEKLPKLLQLERETHARGMTNIGLRHVHQTLQVQYGNTYGVHVESEKDKGTVVCLTLSAMKGDKHVQSAVS